MRKLSYLVVIGMLALATGCSKSNQDGNLYNPTAADVTANATLEELQQGRTIYVDNCGKCHGLYSPDSYTPTQWKSIISNMAPQAHLTSTQTTLVLKYVCRGKQ